MRLRRMVGLAAIFAVALVGSAEAGDAILRKKSKPAAENRSVNLTGCLVHDGQAFRLTQVSGEDAPRVRSWRTLYVRKSTPNVEVVAPARLKLRDHVGQTVAMSGTLNGGRAISARTVRRVAASCR